MRHEGTIDLGGTLEKAVFAARRGDTTGLEVQLAHLRRLHTDGFATITRKLRAIAQAARSHPSFREAPAAQAG